MSTPAHPAEAGNPHTGAAPRPRRLGERLIAKGLISPDDLEKALEIQKGSATFTVAPVPPLMVSVTTLPVLELPRLWASVLSR